MLKQHERFKWACRRGMLELDLFLLPFYENHAETLTEQERKIFWSLLKENDPDIFSWLMGNQEPTNREYTEIVQKIRSFRSLSG